MMRERFNIIFGKLEESGVAQQQLITDRGAIRIIYPSHWTASAEEMDEIAELRRTVREITEGEAISHTTT